MSSDGSAAIDGREYLTRATLLYLAAGRGYGRVAAKVGGLLRQFVLGRLLIADGLREAERISRGLTREKSVALAARALGVTQEKVNDLMRVAAAVELLAGEGGTGKLGYAALRTLSRLVKRNCPGQAVRRAPGDEGLAPSSRESYATTCPPETASRLFREAADAGWLEGACRQRLRGLGVLTAPPGPGRHGCRPKHLDGLVDFAASAIPKDLADMVMALIARSPQADFVADYVLAGLRKLRHNC